MKYILIFFSAILILSSCSIFQSKSQKHKKMNVENLSYMNGYIFSKQVHNNNNNKNAQSKDYYFRYNQQNYFIKITDAKSLKEIEKLDGAFVRAKGITGDGPLETEVNQCIFGDYVVFFHLEKIDQAQIPHKMIYYDGNNNSYEITTSLIKYQAVPVQLSSSGVYSGGADKEIFNDMERYMNVFFKVERLYEDTHLHIDDRVKGSGAFKLIFRQAEHMFVVSQSEELSDFEFFLKSMFE